jgi:hypothetical protein
MTRFMSLAVTIADAGMEGGPWGVVILGPGDGAHDMVGVGVHELRGSPSLSMYRSLSSSSFCRYHAAFSSSVLSPQVITFLSTHSHCWSTDQSGQKLKGVPPRYGLGDR